MSFIKDVDSSILSCSRWNATWEVCKLVELIKVLSSLEENLLVLSKMIIRVEVSISENGNILLEITDLVVKVDEFLGLLLNKERSIGNVELHDGFLLVVNIFQVLHLISCPLK